MKHLSVCAVFAAVVFLTQGVVFAVKADIIAQCPKQASNPLYKKTMYYYAYRLKPQIKEYGCDAIAVYAAFGDENGAILDIAEEEPELMGRLVEILAETPGLAEMLAVNLRLSQALGSRLRDEASRREFWGILENIGKDQIKCAFQGKPEIAALTLLLPRASPQYLEKNFSKRQLGLLLNLVNMTALASSVTGIEGMEELLPYFTTNPADALKVYKKVLEAWGEEGFAKLLRETPEAVSSTVPPLTLDELESLNPLSSQPERFHKMQEDYIRLIHDLYRETANRGSAAWASEYIAAFADILPLALLGNDEDAIAKIRRLLFDLINSEMFASLLKPSACYEQTNLSLLGNLLGVLTTSNQELSPGTHGLAALADWHESGILMPLIQKWLPYTSPENFSLNAKAFLEESGDEHNTDAAFWSALARLALIRSDLLPEQQKILDRLALDLMRGDAHPVTALSFLLEVSEPFFKVMQPGKFNHPDAVAMRLLLAGYPESSDPSLYEAYCRGMEEGVMPKAGRAIERRGGLPEGKLLKDGQTFADRHGGWSVLDMLDAADTAATLGGAVFFTAMTWGAASPALVAAASRVGLKQAARRAAKAAARALAKGARVIPKAARPLVVKGAKLTGKGIKAYVMPSHGAKTRLGKIVEKAEDSYDLFDAARNLYLGLAPASLDLLSEVSRPVEICPGKSNLE